jgi:5'-phosphate synthase pdxT subunit
MSPLTVGVLAFQGDVAEHVRAVLAAAKRLKRRVSVLEVRTKKELESVRALVIPGGESTTLQKLCEREEMLELMKRIPYLFGTCAGAILLAKRVLHKAEDQRTTEVMDITADRNAYGRQASSFEEDIKTSLGPVHAIFIRAPRITGTGKGVSVLAEKDGEVLACEERGDGTYYLAATFHPELTTTAFHEHFLRNCR